MEERKCLFLAIFFFDESVSKFCTFTKIVFNKKKKEGFFDALGRVFLTGNP